MALFLSIVELWVFAIGSGFRFRWGSLERPRDAGLLQPRVCAERAVQRRVVHAIRNFEFLRILVFPIKAPITV